MYVGFFTGEKSFSPRSFDIRLVSRDRIIILLYLCTMVEDNEISIAVQRKADKISIYGRFVSLHRNDELRSRRPIAGQSESGSGDSRPPPPHRPVPSRYAAGSRKEVPNKLLIVHGMERMAVNCDKVFNLFCVYGNVTAVKVLKGKQVLVELQDAEDAKRCVSMLNSLRLDETNELNVK